MSLKVYNQLISDMLNQRHALAKLRVELEGREKRMCQKCGRFRHFARKCRSEEEQKKKIVAVSILIPSSLYQLCVTNLL